jgi:pimeloyl-ACP methyl ester carboxylesterase
LIATYVLGGETGVRFVSARDDGAKRRNAMNRRYFPSVRRRPILALAGLLTGLVSFAAPGSFSADTQSDPVSACRNLASLTGFPVTSTRITLAQFNQPGLSAATIIKAVYHMIKDRTMLQVSSLWLPGHCQVQGIINERIGTDGFQYGDMFEVRLPIPAAWNGRFMLQGGGGTEGTLPPATGLAGTLSPTLAHGWAVATQDGGHENRDLPYPNAFYLEHQAVVDHAYRAMDVTTQTAKFLIGAYYGQKPKRSYFVGCSTGGRQGMVLSQNFPDYYDGIIAGDPVFDLEAISLGEAWSVEHIKAITPSPILKLANGRPILYSAFPVADQNLFQSAILAACDHLDGVVDGVVDNLSACQATFDPATFVFPSNGQPLQCVGAKTATCLAPAQIDAIKKINEGPRDSLGHPLKSPAGGIVKDHADNTVRGYAYDGGYMLPSGIPPRKIGTPTSTPGDFFLGLGQISYGWISPPDPSFDPLTFNFDTDMARLNTQSPVVTYSTSLNIEEFKQRNGKIIWFHGLSDPGPSAVSTIEYYKEMAARNDGFENTMKFARLFLVPNMGHCGGGPATDQFDVLTPLVNWVEHDVAPDAILASGTNFTSPPTTRSRPLCPYPQEVRYVGPQGGDLSVASNYRCVMPHAADDNRSSSERTN